MQTITKSIDVYKFDELPESAQEKAIEKLYDINLDYEWWESIYDDAKNVGINITSFDTDRNNHCQIKNIDSWLEISEAIIKNHGETCDTFKIARYFKSAYMALESSKNEINEIDVDNQMGDLSNEFKRELSKEYASILQKEYEYRYSKEAIIETIEGNDYDFTIDGNIYN